MKYKFLPFVITAVILIAIVFIYKTFAPTPSSIPNGLMTTGVLSSVDQSCTQEFIDAFPILSLPYSFDNQFRDDFSEGKIKLSPIPTKLGVEFLGLRYLNFGRLEEGFKDSIPNGLCAYVGRFEVSPKTIAIIHQQESMPRADMSNIHYVLTTLNKETLQIMDRAVIAIDHDWSDESRYGYNSQYCTIKKDFTIKGKANISNRVNSLSSHKMENYSFQIKENGEIVGNKELTREDNEVIKKRRRILFAF